MDLEKILKAILVFDNEDSFEEKKMIRCLKATDAYLLLWGLREKFWEINRNEEFSDSLEPEKRFNFIRDYFFERLEHYNINLDREID